MAAAAERQHIRPDPHQRNAVDGPYPLALPWSTLAAVVVGIPVVLGLMVMTLTRSSPPRPASGR